MKPTHIEHIGIAVASLDEAIPYYEKVLGLECYAIEEVKDQKVTIVGGGGAATAIQVQLALDGAKEISIFNIICFRFSRN